MQRANPSIAELTEAWLRYHREFAGSDLPDEHPDDWAGYLVSEWIFDGEAEKTWLAILAISERLRWEDEPKVVAWFGAGALEDFVAEFGDRAMDRIEPQLESNETLLKALACVWRWGEPIRDRVDRALAAHQQERL
jgi:hypothetical protein